MADDFMKEIGYPGSKAGGKPTAVAAADPGDSNQGILAPGPMEGVQRGIAKGAAELGVGAARLAGKGIGLFSPHTKSELGELIEHAPGAKQLEAFADRPAADIGETIGDIGLASAVGGYAGPTRIPGLVKGIAGRIAPTAQYVRGLGWVPTRFGRLAAGAGQATEAAAKGAVGGAIENPDDPGTGAAIGATAGAVPPAVSRALRSPAGQYLGGSLTRSVAGMAVPAAIGAGIGYEAGGGRGAAEGALAGGLLHHGLRHSIVSYHSPIGRWLQKFGKGVFDKGGRLIGWINPLTGGFVAGGAYASGAPQQAYEDYTAPAPADEGPEQ